MNSNKSQDVFLQDCENKKLSGIYGSYSEEYDLSDAPLPAFELLNIDAWGLDELELLVSHSRLYVSHPTHQRRNRKNSMIPTNNMKLSIILSTTVRAFTVQSPKQ